MPELNVHSWIKNILPIKKNTELNLGKNINREEGTTLQKIFNKDTYGFVKKNNINIIEQIKLLGRLVNENKLSSYMQKRGYKLNGDMSEQTWAKNLFSKSLGLNKLDLERMAYSDKYPRETVSSQLVKEGIIKNANEIEGLKELAEDYIDDAGHRTKLSEKLKDYPVNNLLKVFLRCVTVLRKYGTDENIFVFNRNDEDADVLSSIASVLVRNGILRPSSEYAPHIKGGPTGNGVFQLNLDLVENSTYSVTETRGYETYY